jgi:hypothetical protein
MRVLLNQQNKKHESGVGFIEVAIVLPIVIFLIMGFIDFGSVMIGRYQMQSAASSIARRLQDTPRISSYDLESTINSILAGLDGQPGTKTVGIQSYSQAPTGTWDSGIAAGDRNFNPGPGIENYWVGVVVRMNMQQGSFMSPYIRNLVPGKNYSSRALVAVKNIQNCGSDRAMISDNNGSYKCGPDCGPRQFPMVSNDGSTVVCGPGGAAGQFLRVNNAGGLDTVSIPWCAGQGILQTDGTNFWCKNVGAMVGQCDQRGQVLRSNNDTIYCANLIVRDYQYAGQWGPHQNFGNCRNGYQCPAGSFVYYHEDNNNNSGSSCKIICGYPIVW